MNAAACRHAKLQLNILKLYVTTRCRVLASSQQKSSEFESNSELFCWRLQRCPWIDPRVARNRAAAPSHIAGRMCSALVIGPDPLPHRLAQAPGHQAGERQSERQTNRLFHNVNITINTAC
jgi:hypothetical protein